MPPDLAAWQPSTQLAGAISSAGLEYALVRLGAREYRWERTAEALPRWMDDARTYTLGHPASEWRVVRYVERARGRRTRVHLTLEGRDEGGHVVGLIVEVGRPKAGRPGAWAA